MNYAPFRPVCQHRPPAWLEFSSEPSCCPSPGPVDAAPQVAKSGAHPCTAFLCVTAEQPGPAGRARREISSIRPYLGADLAPSSHHICMLTARKPVHKCRERLFMPAKPLHFSVRAIHARFFECPPCISGATPGRPTEHRNLVGRRQRGARREPPRRGLPGSASPSAALPTGPGRKPSALSGRLFVGLLGWTKADTFGYPPGAYVGLVGLEREPFEAQLGEGPVAQQPYRLGGDAPPTPGRCQPVHHFSFTGMAFVLQVTSLRRPSRESSETTPFAPLA
jgi:hypothetical protein